MALKVAIFILALGLFLFMGMALLNVEAQREKVGVLAEELTKLQAGAAGQGTAGAAGTGGRLATFDGTTPVLFDATNASSPQALAVPGDPGGDIQLAVVTLTGVEGANGALVPLVSPAVLVQKGVA